MATTNGCADVMTCLLQNGADVHSTLPNGDMAIHTASKEGKWEILKILIENDANIEATNLSECTPLYLSAEFGQTECLRILLEKGANKVSKLNMELQRYLLQYRTDMCNA
jgi:serine/threonine-protein phosphatase 6 regulatory ankyrin repeat subunit B